jgi:hypothetical protein
MVEAAAATYVTRTVPNTKVLGELERSMVSLAMPYDHGREMASFRRSCRVKVNRNIGEEEFLASGSYS